MADAPIDGDQDKMRNLAIKFAAVGILAMLAAPL